MNRMLSLYLLLGRLAVASTISIPPYYANLTWEPARTLSTWHNLTVETGTGTFVGMLNDTYPNVRQFLRIPYAESPVGDLRWLPPQKPEKSKRRYDSTRYGPANGCNMYAPASLLVNLGESLNQGAVAWSSADDCLSLAVWTPADAHRASKLPVALFMTSGGGVAGGIYVPSQLPSPWVSRAQEHIVVTINYRVNIFGNPRSRALNGTSLSLLGVRAAVEWVHEDIEAFGGNPGNIMLWGQSQGAALTHLYTLAFPEDSRVAKFGVISQPPSVTIDLDTVADVYRDFDIVAKALRCNYGDDAEAELECMRQVSWVQIKKFINRCGKEMSSENVIRVMEAEDEWDCTAASDSAMRRSLGLVTYRHLWGGNLSNISPVTWLGAYHWLDLLMIFGTYQDASGVIPQLEGDTSKPMQDHILAFMKDSSTVQETVGWPAFNPSSADGGKILEFGRGTPVKTITGDWLDAGCYNSSVPFRIWG
ncbi:Alpha/Beta hydrolase protein [Aspergillus foveolatus]|uniref:Alpha/Beta hydrolase protein n=1 Tax=Aspergillus foveolatus TaxID=210207 RepID=UPI003CCD707A